MLYIKNCVSAVHLGNLYSEDNPPDLEISNSQIMHNTVSGISSLGASVIAKNCVITHCGYYSLFLAMGGKYRFLHCTINNFWDYSSRFAPGVIVSDYILDGETYLQSPLQEMKFTNSVISGSLKNEIELLSLSGEALSIDFVNCFLKIDTADPMWTGIRSGGQPGRIRSPFYQ